MNACKEAADEGCKAKDVVGMDVGDEDGVDRRGLLELESEQLPVSAFSTVKDWGY